MPKTCCALPAVTLAPPYMLLLRHGSVPGLLPRRDLAPGRAPRAGRAYRRGPTASRQRSGAPAAHGCLADRRRPPGSRALPSGAVSRSAVRSRRRFPGVLHAAGTSLRVALRRCGYLVGLLRPSLPPCRSLRFSLPPLPSPPPPPPKFCARRIFFGCRGGGTARRVSVRGDGVECCGVEPVGKVPPSPRKAPPDVGGSDGVRGG